MNNTITQQGRFTSDGNNITIDLRAGIDWMRVYNITQAATAQTTAVGVSYLWQRGFPDDAKWTHFKSNAANAANLDQYLTSSGFTYVDSSIQAPGALNATITAISNAAIPVVTNTGTNGLVAGDIVRLINVTGARQFSGLDFTVGNNTLSSTTFSLDYAPQIVAGTTGSWRKIPYNPIFYPRNRVISKVAAVAGFADRTKISTTVRSNYTIGQKVRINIPAGFGATVGQYEATVVFVDTDADTFSVDVDLPFSLFTGFAYPTTANASQISYPQITPIGENTAEALFYNVNILDDATDNTGYIGMILTGGANCPGGAADDVIYWEAGTSFSVNNS